MLGGADSLCRYLEIHFQRRSPRLDPRLGVEPQLAQLRVEVRHRRNIVPTAPGVNWMRNGRKGVLLAHRRGRTESSISSVVTSICSQASSASEKRSVLRCVAQR